MIINLTSGEIIIVFIVFEVKGSLLKLENSKNQIKNFKDAAELEVQPFGKDDYPFSEEDYEDLTTDLKSKLSGDTLRYFLYTKKNPLIADELFIGDINAVKNSNFIDNAPLKVLIQGFNCDLNTAIYPAWLNASYLHPLSKDLNIILVDWTILNRGPDYIAAIKNIPIAAENIAKFIKFLVIKNVTTLDKVHLVGHSLGAHLAGDTGYYINQTMGQKVPRVTGLDPVQPMFSLSDHRGRIDSSDGNFVDIIHTTGLEIGLIRSLGHADFYVNGGTFQVGCNSKSNRLHGSPTICGHSRAYKYFSESNLHPKAFKACKCIKNILFGFSSCQCKGKNSISFMGEHLSASARGIFYLETNKKPLYGKG